MAGERTAGPGGGEHVPSGQYGRGASSLAAAAKLIDGHGKQQVDAAHGVLVERLDWYCQPT